MLRRRPLPRVASATKLTAPSGCRIPDVRLLLQCAAALPLVQGCPMLPTPLRRAVASWVSVRRPGLFRPEGTTRPVAPSQAMLQPTVVLSPCPTPCWPSEMVRVQRPDSCNGLRVLLRQGNYLLTTIATPCRRRARRETPAWAHG